MLKSLPDTDIVAIHAFSYFVTLECHKAFFNMNSSFNEYNEFLASLSIDHDGNIFENTDGDFPVVFNLCFDMNKLERRAAMPFKPEKSMSEEDVLHMHFCDSLFEQITPQIYQQSLLLEGDLASLKDKSLANLEEMSRKNNLDIYKLYQTIMMPLINIVDNNNKKLH